MTMCTTSLRPRMLALASVLTLGFTLLGGDAEANKPPEDDLPILEDPSMDRVLPKPGALEMPDKKSPTVVKDLEDPTPDVEEEAEIAIGVHGRVTGWVGGMLDLILDTHPGGYLGGGAGIALEYGPPNSWQVVVEVDWTKVGMPNYNYREKGVSPQSATYAEVDWHLISVDVSYQGMVPLLQGFNFMYRVGAGLGGLAGTTSKAEVLPTCTAETLATCPHWRSATNGELDNPLPVIPVLHVAVGFSVDLGDVAKMRIQGGFRDALYAGLGFAFGL